ncbi:MAG: translation initiation factor IF-2 subunit gamma, partial [Desulfurococcaceae archaeon]
LAKADALVGSVVGKPGHMPDLVREMRVKYELLQRVVGVKEFIKTPPLQVNESIIITAGTATRVGVVKNLTKDYMDIALREPVVSWEGSRIAISRRILGRWRLTGWGLVEEIVE